MKDLLPVLKNFRAYNRLRPLFADYHNLELDLRYTEYDLCAGMYNTPARAESKPEYTETHKKEMEEKNVKLKELTKQLEITLKDPDVINFLMAYLTWGTVVEQFYRMCVEDDFNCSSEVFFIIAMIKTELPFKLHPKVEKLFSRLRIIEAERHKHKRNNIYNLGGIVNPNWHVNVTDE